ncbi:MAG: DUF4340 domain-containing protein [Opitutaceae bacterium]|nr:DUF4340 domain-containing protein [Opitutaceae bacterium]
MRTKVTLVLVFLNVALFFFIFKFERNWQTEAASVQARNRVLGAETADIRRIEVASAAPGVTYSLALKERDSWFLTKPLDWPANAHAVTSIITELQLLEHETSFPTRDLGRNANPTLADYGLEKPRLTVTLGSGPDGATATILRIGDKTNIGNRLYVLSPNGERVHVVNRSLLDALSLPLEKLRADTLLTIPVFEARSLTIQTSAGDQTRAAVAAGLRTRIRRDSNQSNRWRFETPIIASASKLEIDTTISELNALRPKTFNPPAPATLPSAAPNFRITLEGNNRHETLFLGDPVAPVPPAAAGSAASTAAAKSQETEYLAQLDNRTALFTVVVPARLTDKLRNAQVSLRERRFLEFDPRAITAVTITAPILSNQSPITLQRLDAANPDSPWQILRRSAGGQGPQTQPADGTAVQRLLNQLTLLSAKSFEGDAPTNADLENWGFNRPEREVTLTITGAATPLLLQLGTEARQRDRVYARVGTPSDPGTSIYSIDAEILRDLRTDPIAWRQRLIYEFPNTARVTALKIVDLISNQAVFETTLDASGQPAATVPNATALQTVVAGLRKLQAAQFLRDTFPEKVMLGGEERAWRYRLDATVALPVAAGSEQTSTLSLFLTDRLGGAQQVAGSKEIDAIFEIEQPLLDAIWALTYGPRDPGPPPAPKP